MAFSIDTDDIRTLSNYAEAAKWEEMVKPIRGSNPELKPLGKRSKKHINIRREGEDVVVRLYHTDVVTYKPNGEIHLNTGRWGTQSTVKLMYAVLPWGISPRLFKDKLWVRGDYIDEQGVRHHGRFKAGNSGTTILTLDPETRNYRIHNPEPVYVHHINRKAKREVTKQYADFIQWVKAICALRAEDGYVDLSEGEKQKWVQRDEEDRLMLSGDPALYYDAFLSVPNWRRYYNYRAGTTTTTASVSSIIKSIDKHILQTHAATILDKTQAPWGVQADDRYKAYV